MVGLMARGTPAASALSDEFKALYRAQFAFVWRLQLHFGVPEHQVEDAVQDVFVVVHRRLADWDGRSPRSWLYGIARRVASNHRRRSARHQRKIEALPEPRDPALEGRIEDRELLRTIEAALAGLDPGPRTAFVLTEIEGMSAREIAELLDVSPNTIASRLRKARAHVAAALAEIDGDLARNRRSHG